MSLFQQLCQSTTRRFCYLPFHSTGKIERKSIVAHHEAEGNGMARGGLAPQRIRKKNQIRHHQIIFQIQSASKPVFGRGSARTPLGERRLRRSPDRPPSRQGRGYPLPITLPRRLQASASRLSNSASRFSGPLNTNSWLVATPVADRGRTVKVHDK